MDAQKVTDHLVDFISADNTDRAIIINKSFDGYATATLILAIQELRRNLARAGAVGIELPGKKIDVVVTDNFNDILRRLGSKSKAIVTGYSHDDSYADILSYYDPSLTLFLFGAPRLTPDYCRVMDTAKVMFDHSVYEGVATLLDLTGTPRILRNESTVEDRMMAEFFTPFTKRVRNWLDNCDEAASHAVARFDDILKDGWYDCPMPSKEYIGYAAFASEAWPDIDVIRGRAKSLADITTGSDVFLRIDARAQMEREHLAELVGSMERDIKETDGLKPTVLTVERPITRAEMSAVASALKAKNGIIAFLTPTGRYLYKPSDTIDAYSMVPM